LVEVEDAALIVLIVADVGGAYTRSDLVGIESKLSGVDLEFMGVQCQGSGRRFYSKVDYHAALVCPWRLPLEIEERDIVVTWLDTAKKRLSISSKHAYRI
jgi:hypothetical protein